MTYMFQFDKTIRVSNSYKVMTNDLIIIPILMINIGITNII